MSFSKIAGNKLLSGAVKGMAGQATKWASPMGGTIGQNGPEQPPNEPTGTGKPEPANSEKKEKTK